MCKRGFNTDFDKQGEIVIQYKKTQNLILNIVLYIFVLYICLFCENPGGEKEVHV